MDNVLEIPTQKQGTARNCRHRYMKRIVNPFTRYNACVQVSITQSYRIFVYVHDLCILKHF